MGVLGMKHHTYFGFRHGKLETIILSVRENVSAAIDCNYYVDDPQEAEKQIEEWKAQSNGCGFSET